MLQPSLEKGSAAYLELNILAYWDNTLFFFGINGNGPIVRACKINGFQVYHSDAAIVHRGEIEQAILYVCR